MRLFRLSRLLGFSFVLCPILPSTWAPVSAAGFGSLFNRFLQRPPRATTPPYEQGPIHDLELLQPTCHQLEAEVQAGTERQKAYVDSLDNLYLRSRALGQPFQHVEHPELAKSLLETREKEARLDTIRREEMALLFRLEETHGHRPATAWVEQSRRIDLHALLEEHIQKSRRLAAEIGESNQGVAEVERDAYESLFCRLWSEGEFASALELLQQMKGKGMMQREWVEKGSYHGLVQKLRREKFPSDKVPREVRVVGVALRQLKARKDDFDTVWTAQAFYAALDAQQRDWLQMVKRRLELEMQELIRLRDEA